jgi:hypothetical protein
MMKAQGRKALEEVAEQIRLALEILIWMKKMNGPDLKVMIGIWCF